VTIEPRSSRYRRRQINHLATTDGVLAKDIDGIEALRQLRAEEATREIPIMAMTASVMTADRQKITDAGFDAFQSKPLKVKDFVAAVERLLDHPGK
jgi:two-component system cell cycle response regulator DivK